jgi:hypothetical protein
MYKQVSVEDMMNARFSSAQYEGSVPTYPTPDTRAYLYKIRHQTAWKNCKKSKSTFISEIIDNAKKPKGKMPGPPDYGIHTLPIRGRSTKRHLWDKQKRITVMEDVTKTEKVKRGPADYKP